MLNLCRMTKRGMFVVFLVLAMILTGIFTPGQVLAATGPSLGAAVSFGALGGSTVTNTGSSVINGDLGVSPGTAVTGFPPGIVVLPGTIHAADGVAVQAQSDVAAAYNTLAGLPYTVDLSNQDLGGLTLTSGVYHYSSSAQLTGTLTLDAENNANSVFIFQIGTTLTTASNSSVVVINAPPNFCNKYWQVGSSATLGTGTTFQGNILALTSITLNSGASLYGRALAQNGAVTLDNNQITVPTCATSTSTQLSATSITLGQSVTDSVTVTGLGYSSPFPTGTVTFEVSTDGGAIFNAFGAVKTLSNGSATSDSYTPTTAGTYYFRAVYGGVAYYAGSQSGNTDEPLTVVPASSTTTTLLSGSSITLGQSVTDRATVTGLGDSFPIPTETVTFQVSTDGGATFNAFGAVKTLSSGSANSDSYTPVSAGTYYFRAVYSGDSNYSSSQSGNQDEPLDVGNATLITTTTATQLSATSINPGQSVTDTATVTGLGGNSPVHTGTITFQVSTDGGTTFNTFGAVKTLSSGSAASDSYTPTTAGTYYFRAIYGGDSNYSSSQSGAKDEPLVVAIVGKSKSTTTTLLSASTITLGQSVRDTATVIGSGGSSPIPTGPVTFEVSTNSGRTWNAFGAVKTLSNGSATSDSYTPTTAGTYYFRAVYSCDSNYDESQSGDKEEPLTVTAQIPTSIPVTGNTYTGTVASTPVPSGGKNEYNLYLNITGQMVWCAANTADFPNLRTVGATLTGIMDNSRGWWVFKKASGVTPTGNTTGTVASTPVPSGATNEYNLYLEITSGLAAGQRVWCAAKTTDFPNLLTVGATVTGNLNHSPGWWVLIKAK